MNRSHGTDWIENFGHQSNMPHKWLNWSQQLSVLNGVTLCVFLWIIPFIDSSEANAQIIMNTEQCKQISYSANLLLFFASSWNLNETNPELLCIFNEQAITFLQLPTRDKQLLIIMKWFHSQFFGNLSMKLLLWTFYEQCYLDLYYQSWSVSSE